MTHVGREDSNIVTLRYVQCNFKVKHPKSRCLYTSEEAKNVTVYLIWARWIITYLTCALRNINSCRHNDCLHHCNMFLFPFSRMRLIPVPGAHFSRGTLYCVTFRCVAHDLFKYRLKRIIGCNPNRNLIFSLFSIHILLYLSYADVL